MPPRKKGGIFSEHTSGTSTPSSIQPPTPSLALSLSYAPPPHGIYPRPFKNPYYTKNVNRRAKNLKALLTQERERDAKDREARRLRMGQDNPRTNEMDVDDSSVAQSQPQDDSDMNVENSSAPSPSSMPRGTTIDDQGRSQSSAKAREEEEEDAPTYSSIEAPPSLMPQQHWCDITGLEAPYTDPSTGLRYHDRHVYAVVKSLNMPTAKNYLAARGVTSIVK